MSAAVIAPNPTYLFADKTCSTNLKTTLFFKPLTKTTTSFTLTVSAKNPISDVISSYPVPDDDQSLILDDKPQEVIGLVGIYGDPEASRICYLALHPFQHPGKKAAEIVAATPDGVLKSVTAAFKSATEVFDQSKLDQLPGHNAIGRSMVKNVQPLVADYRFGDVAVVHNGNLLNYKTLRAELEENGCIFATSSDTELVLHLIAAATSKEPFLKRVVEACQKLKGSYSMVFLTEDDKLVAVTDPFGFRPLVMGRRRSNGAIVLATDMCALYLIEADLERPVRPGEVLLIDKDGEQSSCFIPQPVEPKLCILELFYFLYTDPVVFGMSVNRWRQKFGEILATQSPPPVDCDVVIEAPMDLVSLAAVGYAKKAGLPLQKGLIHSSYVGRTFSEPWEFGFKLKLSPVRAVLEGKRVLVVVDSIFSATTSSKIVGLLKETGGAKEVHMRIASPRIIAPCCYGVHMRSSEELILNRMSVEEIREFIGCDSLAFLEMDSLKKMLGADLPNLCYACFSGNYPEWDR